MPNYFDQFDAKKPSNFFDQFDAPVLSAAPQKTIAQPYRPAQDSQKASFEYADSGRGGFVAAGKGVIERAMRYVFGSQSEKAEANASLEKLQRELEDFSNKTSANIKSDARARADFVKKNGRFPKEENEDGSSKGSPQDWE